MSAEAAGRAEGARREGSDLRQALVDAASRMLQESRPAPAPSLRAVARACDVSPTAVYLHFASWSALIDAVLEQHFAEARARIDDATRAVDDPRARLDAFSLAFVSWGLAHPGPAQLLFESIDWIKNTRAVHQWLEESVGSLADDLLATGAMDTTDSTTGTDPTTGTDSTTGARALAIETTEHLLTALQGIVSVRRQPVRHTRHRGVEEEVTSMVRIFARDAR